MSILYSYIIVISVYSIVKVIQLSVYQSDNYVDVNDGSFERLVQSIKEELIQEQSKCIISIFLIPTCFFFYYYVRSKQHYQCTCCQSKR